MTDQIPSPPSAHRLNQNHNLTSKQYGYCLTLIDQVEQLYQAAPSYIDSKGVDPGIAYPGNEWAGIVPVKGVTIRRAYNDVNYMRLWAPFAGFHLTFLDRMDQRLHAEPWDEQFLALAEKTGLQDSMIEQLIAQVDPATRLSSCLAQSGDVSSCTDDYRDHTRNVPTKFLVRTPRMFGEIGIEVDGLVVNPDVVLCQSRINGMLSSGVLDKLDADIARRGRARVMEIGPGYGAVAQALRGIYGDTLEYIAVDLPSVLYYSSIYLSVLANGEDCHVLQPGQRVPEQFNYLFVANYLLDEFCDSLGPIDLAINTMSFPEMSVEQVQYYGLLIQKLLRVDGAVFDENDAVTAHHTDSKAILGKIFPFRKKGASQIVKTKSWCQDLWSNSYVRELFDCTDAMFLKAREHRS